MKVILGIDPGSQNTGYGLVRVDQGQIEYIKHGVFSCRATLPFHQRIHEIAQQLHLLFNEAKPQVTVIENIFLGKNADSAFKLGHMRGICMLYAAQAGSEIVEYAARSVKKGITGSGAATKEQVEMLLYARLGLHGSIGKEKIDASDALSLAFYHAQQLENLENLQRGLRSRSREMGQ